MLVEPVAFLFYAGLFLLAIVAVGALSIWLGSRLFSDFTTASRTAGDGETEAEARFGNLQFGIKRAAPGTCFALFGAALISVMVAQGLPEFSQQHTAAASGPARALTTKGLGSATDTEPGELRIALRRADALMAEGSRDEAAAAYARALTHPEVPLGVAARGFNQLGWLAYLDGRPERAIALADLCRS